MYLSLCVKLKLYKHDYFYITANMLCLYHLYIKICYHIPYSAHIINISTEILLLTSYFSSLYITLNYENDMTIICKLLCIMYIMGLIL